MHGDSANCNHFEDFQTVTRRHRRRQRTRRGRRAGRKHRSSLFTNTNITTDKDLIVPKNLSEWNKELFEKLKSFDYTQNSDKYLCNQIENHWDIFYEKAPDSQYRRSVYLTVFTTINSIVTIKLLLNKILVGSQRKIKNVPMIVYACIEIQYNCTNIMLHSIKSSAKQVNLGSLSNISIIDYEKFINVFIKSGIINSNNYRYVDTADK